ncbi:DUF5067 domain-containing protein [Virgibacillus sp. AGTR]|uniref:DUF5067 domain-containing protein n=1 Tax=Virgibacillus sp. AGTR TaxID=2812055 RepID=UPI001D163EAC|nr:DUF5067 domain-containing protein [Virgibacillus sp. AGTR]MCC2250384.1 DUF5067 domain-containing protein [Virgibacillus sp. AGTR]
MKKLVFLLLIALLAITLIACGSGEKEADGTSKSADSDTQQDKSDTEDEVKKEEATKELSDTVLETEDSKIVIKNIEQLTGNYEEKQILAIEMEFTNKSDSPEAPWMEAATVLNAVQETDTTVETLSGGNSFLPEDYKPELAKLWKTDIKSGATVDVVIAYELLYPGNPVRIMDRTLDDKPEKFERIVETTEAK